MQTSDFGFRSLLLAMGLFTAAVAGAEESFETAPVRPTGGSYVPSPFEAVTPDATSVRCGNRSYELKSSVPVPTVNGRALLQDGAFVLDGKPFAAPPAQWTLKTPAVAIAERSWQQGGLQITLKQTVEYDGFVTSDLTLAPTGGPVPINQLALKLVFLPEAAVLYHVSSNNKTPAGLWPRQAEITDTVPGVWGGDDHAGLAVYAATFRDWQGKGPRFVLQHEPNGPGILEARLISSATTLAKSTTWRLGFIATPVREPERKHWQLFSIKPSFRDLEGFASRVLQWTEYSDHYATFVTNDPKDDAHKADLTKEAQRSGKRSLAYTTYAHVETGAVKTPNDWLMITDKGKSVSGAIGHTPEPKRTFLCPGSRAWVNWKLEDIRTAIERYQIDGLYVDTSYVIMACANREHGHGWQNAEGQMQVDLPVWSMREIWRSSYELLCQKRGHADIYAHHKGGCPAALAGFTSAFCDGEQYTSQSIKNLTLDAFRAQITGRNIGPLALFLCEFYRAESRQRDAGHHNPLEAAMLSLVHDVLPTGYPGNHPVRELLQLREDLALTEAEWTPYYAAKNPWRISGASQVVVSSYRNTRGDTVLVMANAGYADAQVALAGPEELTRGRTFVTVDAWSRVSRNSPSTPGYRWEPSEPGKLQVAARTPAVYAWVKDPETLPAFAQQKGFAASSANHARKSPVPAGSTLLDDFEDADWALASDDGYLAGTEREPVDTVRALRVEPKPKHDSAGLIRTFELPQDWSACTELSFWIRPDKALPVRALEPRLRDVAKYGPLLKLVSHKSADVLPAGQWTQLRYAFDQAPRNEVHILRIYFHRHNLGSGPFDLDEMMLHGGAPKMAGKAAPAAKPGVQPKAVKPTGAID